MIYHRIQVHVMSKKLIVFITLNQWLLVSGLAKMFVCFGLFVVVLVGEG